MNIQEEITQLETKVQDTVGLKEQAEVILILLEKYRAINSKDGAPHIQMLQQIAEQLNNDEYKAWAYHYNGVTYRISGNYPSALTETEKALQLFASLNCSKGIALSHHDVGVIHYFQGNYTEAVNNHLAALKIWREMGDNWGISACYLGIGTVEFRQGNYTNALTKFAASLKIKEEIGSKPGIAICYNNIASVYWHQGNRAEALTNWRAYLKISQEIGDKTNTAFAYNNLGMVYERQGDYAGALSYFLLCLEMQEEIDSVNGIAFSYNNIGGVYWRQGDYPMALKSYFAALEINKEIGDKQGIADCLNNIGLVYFNQENYDEALSNQLTCLKIVEEMGDKPGIAQSLNAIGNIYIRQGNYIEALSKLLQGLKIIEETGNKELMGETLTYMGKCYMSLKEYDRAEDCLTQSVKLANEIDAKDEKRDALKVWYELKRAQGNGMAALEYYEQFVEIDKELTGAETANKVTAIQHNRDMLLKEKEMEIERLRTVELKMEKERSDALLKNILPGVIINEINQKGISEPKLYENVTVLFTDFKDFTKVSERLTPQELVNELDACFKAFDGIIGKYGLEKIKTVGDAYLAVAGLPAPNTNHAIDMVNAALEIRDFMLHRKKERETKILPPGEDLGRAGAESFEIRIGLNSGQVVAGIVGLKKFAYDIWGDTVNTAARMEQNGEAGKVNISESTYALVKDKCICMHRGKIKAKNKGEIDMYFVER